MIPLNDEPAGVRATQRVARRRRRLVGAGVAAVLAWTGVSFMAGSAETVGGVSILPGAAANGSVADVFPLSDTVSSTNGGAQKQAGVKFARVDAALSYQDRVRLTLSWRNPTALSEKTGTHAWQIRTGVYYPVHTGACTGSEANTGALNVTLTASENWGQASGATYCAFPDTAATGPGAVTSGSEQGTQLMAVDYLVASLRPLTTVTDPQACTTTGTTACTPDGLGANRRTWFVIGSLTSPGGNVPPGQVGDLASVDMFVRASKIGG